jgi:glycyl-tRNA synthetase beta subunit
MRVLGIRVEPKKSTFIVIERDIDDNYTLINEEVIKVPIALSFPEQLKYIRNTVIDILREYEITFAGIKLTESIATADLNRVQFEGVIQEAFSSSEVKDYFSGRKLSIMKRLGISKTIYDSILNGEQEYPIINWNRLTNKNLREAALVAIGAIQ